MSIDNPLRESRIGPAGETDDGRAELEEGAILDLCDRVLGEVGRRRHLFSWLKVPGLPAEAGDPDDLAGLDVSASARAGWLSVDAYYPSRRLIVLCRRLSDAEVHACAQLAPEHGLRVLRIEPDSLTAGRQRSETALRQALAKLGRSEPASEGRDEVGELPSRPAEPTALERTLSRLSGSWTQAAAAKPDAGPSRPSQAEAAQRAVRHVKAVGTAPRAATGPPARSPRPSAPRGSRTRSTPLVAKREAAGRTAAPRRQPVRSQALAGTTLLALAAALAVELYVGVSRIAVGGGHWLLAFGLALDAASRALGTIAARRARRSRWGSLCALGGSPAVAAFVLLGEDGQALAEPAPLAGITALLAMLSVGLAVL